MMLTTSEGERWLEAQYQRHRTGWLVEGDGWEVELGLKPPGEIDFASSLVQSSTWVQEWQRWDRERGGVSWARRNWRTIGAQTIPCKVKVTGPSPHLALIGKTREWEEAERRRQVLWDTTGRHPEASLTSLYFEASARDFDILVSFLCWVQTHNPAGMMLRSIPVEGMDTKWMEKHQRIVKVALRHMDPEKYRGDRVEEMLGLQEKVPMISMRYLDPVLQAANADRFSEHQGSTDDWSRLASRPQRVIIVENKHTYRSLPPMEGTMAIWGAGDAAHLVGEVAWLPEVPDVVYWGDIDTDGLCAIGHLREKVPAVRTILMDGATLERYRAHWGVDRQGNAEKASHLTTEEAALLRALRTGPYKGIRLEQERIPIEAIWEYVQPSLVEDMGE